MVKTIKTGNGVV